MKKETAIKIFGTPTKMADALGVTPQRVSNMPHDLQEKEKDRIVGCALRLDFIGVHHAKELLKS